MCTIENNSGGEILKRDVLTHNRDLFARETVYHTNETYERKFQESARCYVYYRK